MQSKITENIMMVLSLLNMDKDLKNIYKTKNLFLISFCLNKIKLNLFYNFFFKMICIVFENSTSSKIAND